MIVISSLITCITLFLPTPSHRSNTVDPKAELTAACRDKNYTRAHELLALGVDPCQSRIGFFNWSPLHFLCHDGELRFAKVLIETYECQPEAEDKEGRVALHLAAQSGHVHVVRYLVKNRRCTADYTDIGNQTPLHHACGWLSLCSEEKALEMSIFLVKKCYCDPNLRDMEGKNALLHACEKGFLTIVKYLVDECQCDLSVIDNHGNTSLHYAVAFGDNLDLVRYIYGQVDVDITVTNNKGNTILHNAYASNCSRKDEIIEFLLTEGKFERDMKNIQGKTPFEMSLLTGPERLFELTSINQSSHEQGRNFPALEATSENQESHDQKSCAIL